MLSYLIYVGISGGFCYLFYTLGNSKFKSNKEYLKIKEREDKIISELEDIQNKNNDLKLLVKDQIEIIKDLKNQLKDLNPPPKDPYRNKLNVIQEEIPNNKVFCKTCKHFLEHEYNINQGRKCCSFGPLTIDPIMGEQRQSCSALAKNKNYDCPDFFPKLREKSLEEIIELEMIRQRDLKDKLEKEIKWTDKKSSIK